MWHRPDPVLILSAFHVYVARAEPRSGKLCLTVTDSTGTTVLVQFDDPGMAIAVGTALRAEGEAAVVAGMMSIPAAPAVSGLDL